MVRRRVNVKSLDVRSLKFGELPDELRQCYKDVIWSHLPINDGLTRKLMQTALEATLAKCPSVTRSIVVCDETNNPPSVISARDLVANVSAEDHWLRFDIELNVTCLRLP